MKKIILLVTLFFSIFFTIQSEEISDTNLSHYIGGAAGFSTGIGLSYRYWPGDWGGQVVFAPLSTGEYTTISLGIAGMRTLHETKYTRLFLFLAANGLYEEYVEYTWDEDTFEETGTETVERFTYNVGIGPGIEVYLFKHIVLDFMVGFRYGFGGYMSGLGLTGEFAIYYRF